MRSINTINNDLNILNKELKGILGMTGEQFDAQYKGATIGEILIEIASDKNQLKEERKEAEQWEAEQEEQTVESICTGNIHN